MFDLQSTINWLFGVVVGVIGYVVRHLHGKAEQRISILEAELKLLPETYSRRDDVKEMKREILEMLSRIETKVDNRNHNG
jgi:hypothetical protein